MRNSKRASVSRPPMPPDFYGEPENDAGFVKLDRAVAMDPMLNATSKIVYTAIRDFAWGKSWAWPGQELLASKTRLSVRTVKRAVKALRDRGVLHVTIDPKRQNNTYHFVRTNKVYPQATIDFLRSNPSAAQWQRWYKSKQSRQVLDRNGCIVDPFDVNPVSVEPEVGTDLAPEVGTDLAPEVGTDLAPETDESSFGREEDEVGTPREARTSLPEGAREGEEYEREDQEGRGGGALLGEVEPRGLKNPPTPLRAPRHGQVVEATTVVERKRAKQHGKPKARVETTPAVIPEEMPFDAPTQVLRTVTGAEPPREKKAAVSFEDVYAMFRNEVVTRWPELEFSLPTHLGHDGRMLKMLKTLRDEFQLYDSPEGDAPNTDTLRAAIRVCVWDWAAIQDTPAYRYVKGGGAQPGTKAPDLPTFCRIAAKLRDSGALVHGVTSAGVRVSDYVTRYVKPQAPVEPQNDFDRLVAKLGMSRAATSRRVSDMQVKTQKARDVVISELLATSAG